MCIQSHLYVFSLVLFIFSQLICIQSHLVCIQSDLIYIQSSFKCIQFTFIFYKHIQCAVRHLENLIKISSFFKTMKEMNACHTIISYKEIMQTKILSKRPLIRPGRIYGQTTNLVVLYSGELIYGGAYIRE